MPAKKTHQADCNHLQAEHCFSGRERKREIRECFSGSAARAIGDLKPGCEIFGFTKGQFSLMDVIVAVLEQTGPAHVDLSTWTAAHADINHAHQFVESGRILSSRWVVDRSFPTRQPDYFRMLLKRFGPEAIRVTRTHAKFVLIQNDDWDIVIRSSMNLNKNPRFENFEISEDAAFAGYFRRVVDEIFTSRDCGDIPTTREVDDHFEAIEILGECSETQLALEGARIML